MMVQSAAGRGIQYDELLYENIISNFGNLYKTVCEEPRASALDCLIPYVTGNKTHE